MIGPKKKYSVREKRKMMDECIKKQNPYAPSKPLDVDLRAFYAHVKENNLSNQDITPETIEKFSIH